MKPAGHPKELYVLFFTEMWERFGYYLMLAIFVFYLNERLGLTQGEAMSLYGTYIALVYLSPLLGGVLADKLLGQRKSVLLGCVVLALGYFLVALDREPLLYTAIGVLVLGNGLFKPNIAAMVGGLYQQNDPRRDAAFGIFYMGVNLGALLSPLAASYLRGRYGWGVAFGAAGTGMLIGLGTFAIFGRNLGARMSATAAAAAASAQRKDDVFTRRERMRALLMSCGIVTFFWIAFQQNGSTLAFWARDNVDLTLGGALDKPMNPEIFAAVNPLFILLLTPALLGVFRLLRARGLEPSTPAKIGLGMVMTAVAYGLMMLACLLGGNTGRVSAMWLVSTYFIITVAELMVSPMGLSMVTRLAPRGTTAIMLGVWYLSTSFGNKMAGQLGKWLWEAWPHHSFFALLVGGSLLAAVVLAVQLPRLVNAMETDPARRQRRNSGRIFGLRPFAPAAPATTPDA
jgi:POT family proton-dependent oligopeptide transporter